MDHHRPEERHEVGACLAMTKRPGVDRYRAVMVPPLLGITLFPTAAGLHPATLAREVEQRGFESLFLPEHSHIPASRETPWPGARPGAEDLPAYYWQINDQLVSLSMAAAVTTDLKLGTAVTLVAQHDPIWLAKQLATLDRLSAGRVILGVGFAWNREQCRSHQVDFATRRERTRDHVGIMRALWNEDPSSYAGDLRSLEPSWAYPKPQQLDGPPILLGGGWGPKLLSHLCEWADGWMPISARPSLASRLALVRAEAERRGRDPNSISVTVMGAIEDAAGLAALGEEGVERAVLTIWPTESDAVLQELDRLAEIRRELDGT